MRLSSSPPLSILIIISVTLLSTYGYDQQIPYRQWAQNLEQQGGAGLQLMATSNCQTNCAICSPPTFTACQQCAIGYVLQTSGQCVACSPGCQYCVGEFICSSCRSGYAPTSQLRQMRCVPCSLGCKNCYFLQMTSGSTVELTSCSTCFPGYYLYNQTNSTVQTCSPCIAACFTCQDTKSCFQCVSGFGYNQTSNQCYPCRDNCISCSPTSGCYSCMSGFYTISVNNINQCAPCFPNCIRCINSYSCSTCVKGYYPNNVTNQQTQITTTKCVPCPNQCLKCYNQKYCLSCGVGYFLNVVSQLEYNSTEDYMYPTVLSSTCQPCPSNCLACTESGSCSQCESGYFVDGFGFCNLCGVACHECLASGQCLSCQGSNFLSHGFCKPCVEPCTSCYLIAQNNQQSVFCTACISLYFTPINGECLSCSSLSAGCSTCQSQNECLSCSEGYNLHQGKCFLKHQLGAAYVVMICIAGIIGMIAIGFGLWACWRARNGVGFGGDSNNPGVRASYYQIP